MNNIQNEEVASIQDLIALVTFYRNEGDRARKVLIDRSKLFGRQVNEVEITRAGHEYDLLADAHMMVLKAISERAIKNKVGKTAPIQMTILYPETKEEVVIPDSPKIIALPKIENKEAAEEANSIINEAEIEENIYEAASLSSSSKDEHWNTARSKAVYFFAGVDGKLSKTPSEFEVDNFIKGIVKKTRDKIEKTFIEENLLERSTSPFTSFEEIQRVQYVKDNKFNIAVLLGKNNASTEDRMKLTAIHEFVKGNEKKAISIIRLCYKAKNWDEFVAREFLYALMRKDPHKELEIVVHSILKDSKLKKGDPKKGIKLCRNIIGCYFDKKYTPVIEGNTLSVENQKNNQLIDRIINRNLKKLS